MTTNLKTSQSSRIRSFLLDKNNDEPDFSFTSDGLFKILKPNEDVTSGGISGFVTKAAQLGLLDKVPNTKPIRYKVSGALETYQVRYQAGPGSFKGRSMKVKGKKVKAEFDEPIPDAPTETNLVAMMEIIDQVSPAPASQKETYSTILEAIIDNTNKLLDAKVVLGFFTTKELLQELQAREENKN